LGTAAIPLFEPPAVAQSIRQSIRFGSALHLAGRPSFWPLAASGVGVMVIFARNDAQSKRTLCADRWCKSRVEKSAFDLNLRCNDWVRETLRLTLRGTASGIKKNATAF
jgi:hypothetical protein